MSLRSLIDHPLEIASIYIGAILSSGWLFSLAESKPYLDSVWWALVTATTIGYGDVVPLTLAGKTVAIFLMHFVSMFIIPLIVANILTHVVKDPDEFTHEEQEEIKNLLRDIRENM